MPSSWSWSWFGNGSITSWMVCTSVAEVMSQRYAVSMDMTTRVGYEKRYANVGCTVLMRHQGLKCARVAG